jgi:imidazolonepropionase-like amidohydrolase
MMMMDGWTWEEMRFHAPAGLLINWPAMYVGKSTPQQEEEQKKNRDDALREIKDAFHDARAYTKAKNAEQDKGIPYHDRDVRWEAMIPVLEGKVPVIVRANDVQQIQAAVAWAADEKFRLIILGGADAGRVTDLLKKYDVAVIVGGTFNLPSHRFDRYDGPYALSAVLYRAGIRFAIATGDEAANERNLPYHAACAAAYGLPKDEALKAITLYPAQIFDVASRIGSLEIGKDATIILTTGDPLDIRSSVSMEFIQGRRIDLSNKQTRLFEKYKEKYRRQ